MERDPLFDQARRVSPQWWLLLVVAPLLSAFVLASVDFRFTDLATQDVKYAVRPAHPELTSATVTLEEGELEVRTAPGPWRQVRVEIIAPGADPWRVRISRDFAATTMPEVLPGDLAILEGKDLPGPPISDSPFRITVSPRSPERALTDLRLFRVTVSPLTSQDRPPALPGAILAGLLPLAFSLFLLRGGRRTPQQALLIGSLGGAAAAGIGAFNMAALPFLWAAATAFFLGTATMSVHSYFRSRKELDHAAAATARALMEVTTIAAVLCFALWIRWDDFVEYRNAGLMPDAAGYLEIAREGSFYHTAQVHAPWVREPLFPALLRAWFVFMPDTTTSARFLMLLLGLLPVALTWFAGRKLFGRFVALLAAVMMAFNPWLAGESVAVLRDTLLTSLFLGLLAVPLYAGEWKWGRAALFGVLGLALALTRVNALFLLVPFVGIEAWRRRWHPGEIALVFLIAVPFMVPHFLFNAEYSGGDYLFSSNVHTRYYLNYAMMGQPGYPADLAAWNADPYAGGTVGMLKLVSELGPAEMLLRTLRGYIMIFVYEFPHEYLFYGHEIPMIFGLFGAVVLWKRRRELWWPVLWLVLFMLPVAMIATIRLDRRLAMVALPFILWIWAAGVEYAGLLAWEAFRRRRSASDKF